MSDGLGPSALTSRQAPTSRQAVTPATGRGQPFNGEFGSLIVNENGNGQAIVTIEPTDKGFTTKDCGTWSPLPASGHQATTMGDGTWGCRH